MDTNKGKRHMIRTFTALALATAAAAAPTAEERADDRFYVHGGPSVGVVYGGDFDTATGFGLRAEAGVRISPDVALQLGAGVVTDIAASGYEASDATLGATWFVFEHLRLSGGVHYRQFVDSESIGEGIGAAFGAAFGAVLCDGDPECQPEIVSERLTVHDLGLELGLAIEWQWGSFTLSVEWLAAYQPIALLAQTREVKKSNGEELEVPSELGLSDLPIDVRFGTVMLGASF